MSPDADETATRRALDTERRFVLSLGGFALEIAGGVLVTHERLPSPRFNFVEVGAIGPDRLTAFLERALDHYFQRAIRPTFRVRPPVPSHLDAGLRRLGFRARANALEVMVAADTAEVRLAPGLTAREAERADLDVLAAFWANERERPEWRSALETVWAHPNPGERLSAVLAESATGPVAAALLYVAGSSAGVYAVATQPGARGQGAASAVVARAQSARGAADTEVSILSDRPRLRSRLEALGFRRVGAFLEYELAADARLEIPPVGAPAPPRWRPPRPRG